MPGQTVTLGLVGLAVAPGLGRCAGVPNIGNWVVLGEHNGGICKGCLCLSDASASRGWRPGQAVVRARAGGVHAGAAGISSRGLGGRRGQVQTDLRARARSHCCALAGVAPDCPHALPWSQGLATGYAQQSRLVMGVGPVGYRSATVETGCRGAQGCWPVTGVRAGSGLTAGIGVHSCNFIKNEQPALYPKATADATPKCVLLYCSFLYLFSALTEAAHCHTHKDLSYR